MIKKCFAGSKIAKTSCSNILHYIQKKSQKCFLMALIIYKFFVFFLIVEKALQSLLKATRIQNKTNNLKMIKTISKH